MQPSGLLRNMRNVVHNYTEVEIKVREATSNDPWGPSSSIMAEISDLTYQVQPFPEIMAMLWKRLSDHGKNWRHVYKSLMLLDYLVKTGSERVAAQCKENIYCITTLKDFQFVDRDGKDQGANVRERAKQLVSLLQDEDRLRSEREKSLKNKERFSKSTTGIGSHSTQQIGYSSTANQPGFGGMSSSSTAIRSSGEEELQLQLALAMSKEEADEAEKARREDQVRVELAIKESLKENSTQQSSFMAEAKAASAAPPPAPTSNIDDLLSLDMVSSQPPPQPQHQNPPPEFNPWGGPTQAAPSQAQPDPFGADPWGAPAQSTAAAAPPQQAANPWGAPAASITAPSPAQPPSDPWGAPAANDPFGAPVQSTPAPVVQQAPPPQDPFGTADPFGGGVTAQQESNNDMFSLPPNPEPAAAQPSASPFDLGDMGSSLPPTQATAAPVEPEKKTAQSFLGSAAGLVNLDNLVQKPKEPAVTNPFGMSSAMTPQVKSNPFHNASPGPSMAEMARSSQTQQMGLQQPMAPSPVNNMAQSPFGAPMMSQPFGMDAQSQSQKSNNPFL